MSDCATCGASFDCTDPLTLYSLQSVSFPFVPICPAGVTCDIGSDFHLICCQQDIFIQFPPGFDATQKQGVIAGAVAECQRQAAFCPGCENPPCVPCPTPPCVLNLYWNHSQTCSVNCPDGTPFSATIVAGTYLATSQIEADTFAFRGACARAKDHRICLSALDEALCADDAASLEIKGTGKYLANGTGSDFWAVIDGEIPTGMTFEGGFRTDRKCVLDGTPTTAGVYTFTVRVTVWTPGAAFGDYTEKSYTVKVVGIAPANLPDATIGTAYSQNLTVNPTHDQETEQWILLTSLPAGLTMTEAGVITGTPTGPSESHDVEVQVEFTLDGKQVTCSKEYTLTVNDGLVTPIEYWKMEENNVSRVGQVTGLLLKQGFLIVGHPEWDLPIPSAAGKILQAVKFTNSAFPYQILNSGNSAVLRDRGTGWTIAGWANMATALQTVFNWSTNGNASANATNGGGGFKFKATGRDDNNTLWSVTAPDSPTPGVFYFFRLWFDPSDGKVHAQVNNGTTDESVGGLQFAGGINAAFYSAGDDSFNPGTIGLLDEVGIYMPHLTNAQATLLYNAGAGKTCCPFA